MEQNLIINFLESFFKLFDAEIGHWEKVGNSIYGVVYWENEEDRQDFSLKLDFDSSEINNAKLFCDYLSDNNLVNTDNIKYPEQDLINSMKIAGWKESEAKNAINFLCSFEVKMLDDGVETDSFLIHF